MLLKSLKNNQSNLFHSPLNQMLDMNDPLIALSEKPIHLMVGLLLLKQIENLSDDNVVLQWKRNPYYQYFCGYNEFQIIEPCHPTDLTYFRNRIGVEYIGKKEVLGTIILASLTILKFRFFCITWRFCPSI